MDRITEYDEEDLEDSKELGLADTANKNDAVDQKDNRAVARIRYVVFLVLLSVTVAVSMTIYVYNKNAEVSAFEDHFKDQAAKVANTFTFNAERRLEALMGFSNHITSHALTSGEQFPMVTLPNFERHATITLQLAEVVAMVVLPVVTFEQREDYVKYTMAKQGWINDGLALQQQRMDEDNEEVLHLQEQFDKGQLITNSSDVDSTKNVPPLIFKVKPGTTEPEFEDGPGPYTPFWTFAPAIPAWNLVNFNAFTHPTRFRELTAFLQAKTTLLSSAADLRKNDPLTTNRKSVMNLFLNRWQNGTFEYEEGPVSDIYVPIYDSFEPDKKLGQILSSYIYWQSYFTNVLPEGQNGIVSILENSCGQSFTYVIHGPEVTYVGEGDLHETKYDDLVVQTGFGAFLGKDAVEVEPLEAQCFYNVRIYPSAEMEADQLTNSPLIFALGLMGVFLFTSVVFLTYDRVVARRHEKIETKAIRSTAVVQSLFPENVRDRLYDSGDRENKKTHGGGFWNDADRKNHAVDSNMPIADLYPECTVLFADIVGFTSWSALHTPAEVFKLLETLYARFDKIAKKRRVFKVETIGDCYVAVTGLPEVQEDHAVFMAKFAAQCLEQLNPVLHSLVDRLGPETANLNMRYGLNSGPVTAGVLRGEKARFQLFGDTVNTAARMESTGAAGRIHISQNTADLLVSAGLDSWVVPRETMIEAKGKGKLQTFWIAPEVELSFTARSTKSSRLGRQTSAMGGEDDDEDEARDTVSRAVHRLVNNNSTQQPSAF
uniref:Guanylate cyclase domain-containing protein n=1 Tax=Amphora coffeiformis TaxID=265554 RepID=A0A7S3PD05_9STRA